jgi:hypothetical protein
MGELRSAAVGQRGPYHCGLSNQLMFAELCITQPAHDTNEKQQLTYHRVRRRKIIIFRELFHRASFSEWLKRNTLSSSCGHSRLSDHSGFQIRGSARSGARFLSGRRPAEFAWWFNLTTMCDPEIGMSNWSLSVFITKKKCLICRDPGSHTVHTR